MGLPNNVGVCHSRTPYLRVVCRCRYVCMINEVQDAGKKSRESARRIQWQRKIFLHRERCDGENVVHNKYK
jgi:hypothetical protein